MHDCLSNMALNKREQKNQHKEVAKINDEILKEESSQIMSEQSYLQQPRPVQQKNNVVTLMQFLVSSAPPKEKIQALLKANGTLLDYSFLLMLQRSPGNIDDETIIAAQAEKSLDNDQYLGIIAISLMKQGACVGKEFRKMIKNHQSLNSPMNLFSVFYSIGFAFEPEVNNWMEKNLGRMSTKISDFLQYRQEGGDCENVAIKL